jgi:prepilin-type N-terminal cleavage/methylation domain-containing protein
MKKNFAFMDKKGFSLVEVMVAAGMLGLVSLGVMKLTENQSKSSKTFETKFEVTSIVAEIRTLLSNSDSCTSTFVTNPANGGAAYSYNQGALSDPMSLRNTRGAVTTDKYTANSDKTAAPTYGNANVKILSYELSDADPSVGINAGETQGTTHLIVEFYRGRGGLGKETITKRILINVEREGPADNRIKDCNIGSVGLGSVSCTLLQGNYLAGPPEICELSDYRDPSANDDKDFAISESYMRDLLMLDGDAPNTLAIGDDPATDAISFNTTTMFNGDTTIDDGYSFSMASDKRLKTNFQEIKSASQKISMLNGFRFNWKSNGRSDIGLIAQEVNEIFPSLVLKNSKGFYSVKYAQFVPLLIEAHKEVLEENRKLRSNISEISKLNIFMIEEICKKDKSYKFCN